MKFKLICEKCHKDSPAMREDTKFLRRDKSFRNGWLIFHDRQDDEFKAYCPDCTPDPRCSYKIETMIEDEHCRPIWYDYQLLGYTSRKDAEAEFKKLDMKNEGIQLTEKEDYGRYQTQSIHIRIIK